MLESEFAKSSSSSNLQFLDLSAVLNFIEEIADETDFDHLVVKIMKKIIIITGAQRGVFFLKRDGEFYLEIDVEIDSKDMPLEQPIPFSTLEKETNPKFPLYLLRYIIRTTSFLVSNKKQLLEQFPSDKYIQSSFDSVLSFPITYQKKVIGIIYLENSSTSDLFFHHNVELLKLLALHIAVCLENNRQIENSKIIWVLLNKLAKKEKEKSKKPKRKILPIKEGKDYFLIPWNEILYIQYNNSVTVIQCIQKAYQSSKSLVAILQELDTEVFIRVHKNYILNTDWISHIQYFIGGSYIAYLKDKEETEVPIGKSYAPIVKKHLGID